MAVSHPITNDPDKLCPICTKMQPAYLFNRRNSICMECASIRGIRDPLPVRPAREMAVDKRLIGYGLTFSGYKRLYFAQNGKCAICGMWRKLKRYRLPFVIDHDHETGLVRGLLCNNCNLGLGIFRDQIDRFENASRYIKGLKTSHM